MLDRLLLDEARIKGMRTPCGRLRRSRSVGSVDRMWLRPNGLQVGKMRIPLGVIGIIYEARRMLPPMLPRSASRPAMQ